MRKTLLAAPVILVIVFLINCEPEEITPEAQLAIDIELIDKYLNENGITATEDPSGLRYVIHEQGDGETPAVSDTIVFTYNVVMMTTGSTVDEATSGVTYPLFRMVQAWQIAIPKIQEGGSMTLYAPSGLCYGRKGQDPIPPDANLIFDIALLEVL